MSDNQRNDLSKNQIIAIISIAAAVIVALVIALVIGTSVKKNENAGKREFETITTDNGATNGTYTDTVSTENDFLTDDNNDDEKETYGEDQTTSEMSGVISDDPTESQEQVVQNGGSAAANNGNAAANEDVNHGDSSSSVKITVGTVTGSAGDTVEVPITISGNPGFSSTGIKYFYDEKLKFEGIDLGLVKTQYTAENTDEHLFAVASAESEDITDDGVLYTAKFTIPSDAKSGDKYSIVASFDSFANAENQDVAVQLVDGEIDVK